MSIPLLQLIPAKTRDDPVEAPRPPNKTIAKMQARAKVRLIAQEYVRNGMSFPKAYQTVTGHKAKATMFKTLRHHSDEFVDEIGRVLERSDIERESALNLLWAMVNTSILDFVDEHGTMLPVSELKRLPRVMQVMIHKMKVTTTQLPVRDENGKYMLDDVGRPFLKNVSKVEIEIPEKITALTQLAQLMKWVSPAGGNTTYNIGTLMVDADSRGQRLGRTYDAE